MTEIIPVSTPFTPREYYGRDAEGRIELLKDWAAEVAKHAPEFSWEDLRKRFEKSPNDIVSCGHEIQTLRTVLEYEARLEDKDREMATLRASMEDLCREMEEVRTASGGYRMGPGTEGPNR